MKGLLEAKGNVNPQEQSQIDRFVLNGMKLIHNEKTTNGIVQQLKNSENPVETVANITLAVMKRLEQDATQKKFPISNATRVQGGAQLMGELFEIVEAAGMEPLTEEQKYQAFSIAVAEYIKRGMDSGQITPEQIQQAAKEVMETSEGQKIAQEVAAVQKDRRARGRGQPQQQPQGQPQPLLGGNV